MNPLVPLVVSGLVYGSYHLLVSPVINTIDHIKNSISSITTQNSDLKSNEIEFDIINKRLEVISTFLKELSEEKNIPRKTIEKIINNLSCYLKDVNLELTKIKLEIVEHEKKFFSSYRSLNLENNIKMLKIKDENIKSEFKSLVDLLIYFKRNN